MRILMLHDDRRNPSVNGSGGGAEVILWELVKQFQANGHEVGVCHGGDVIRQVEAFKPYVCHAMSTHRVVGMENVSAIMDMGIPVVWYPPDYWPFCKIQNMQPEPGRSCMARTDVCVGQCANKAEPRFVDILNRGRVVAYNKYTADIYERNGLRVDAVAECGVDTETFHPDVSERSEDVSIYTSSAWASYPTKGMHVLRAAIAGQSYGANLLTGMPRQKVAEQLRRAHIYVFPSTYEETWGLCLTEAMASGCACIASDVAGAKAQIIDGENGLLFENGNHIALRACIERLLGDAELRERLGLAARRSCEETFNLKAMADRLEAQYRIAMK